jgi:UDP-N-acetyl-D-mannosaminuronate dehydrogenase
MKPISLTADHKKKLLEMCTKLFPNKTHWELVDEDDESPEIGFYHKPYGKGLGGECIHWYEFCLTELNRAIANALYSNVSNVARVMSTNASEIVILQQHPIAYLYPQFKKIK